MSRTIKGEKGAGFEYWGRRKSKLPFQDAGSITKHFTHRAERTEAKAAVVEGQQEWQSSMSPSERANWFYLWAEHGNSEWFVTQSMLNRLDDTCHPLVALRGVQQDPRHHPEGCALSHSFCVVDAMKQIVDGCGIGGRDRQLLMMAALCHDFGKASTTRWNPDKGTWTAYGHDQVGAKLTYVWMTKELGWLPENAAAVAALVDQHMVHVRPEKNHTLKAANKVLVKLVDAGVHWRHLVLLMLADCNGRPPIPPGLPVSVVTMNARIRELDPNEALPDDQLGIRQSTDDTQRN